MTRQVCVYGRMAVDDAMDQGRCCLERRKYRWRRLGKVAAAGKGGRASSSAWTPAVDKELRDRCWAFAMAMIIFLWATSNDDGGTKWMPKHIMVRRRKYVSTYQREEVDACHGRRTRPLNTIGELLERIGTDELQRKKNYPDSLSEDKGVQR
jgi:hypothetical protein